MKDVLLNVAVLAGILILSAVVTNWFARTMYRRCPACSTLNARRRAHCRACGQALK